LIYKSGVRDDHCLMVLILKELNVPAT